MGIGCNIKFSIKKLSGDVRAWVFMLGVVWVVFTWISGFTGLPKRMGIVEADIKTEVVERKDSVGELADTVKDYILKQDLLQEGRELARIAKERAEDKKEELLHKWIDAITNK